MEGPPQKSSFRFSRYTAEICNARFRIADHTRSGPIQELSYVQTERRMNQLPLLRGGTTAGNGFGATRHFGCAPGRDISGKRPGPSSYRAGFLITLELLLRSAACHLEKHLCTTIEMDILAGRRDQRTLCPRRCRRVQRHAWQSHNTGRRGV